MCITIQQLAADCAREGRDFVRELVLALDAHEVIDAVPELAVANA